MKIRFQGATRQVTGSSYFVDAPGVKILVDCGLFQERDYSYRNWQPFPVHPEQIDYLLLTHVHHERFDALDRRLQIATYAYFPNPWRRRVDLTLD